MSLVPKLRYALTTAPFPLQASVQGGSSPPATLHLVVSNPNPTPVTLAKLAVGIPVGNAASDLTASTNIGTTVPSGWKVQTGMQSGMWTATFTADTPVDVTTASLEFVFQDVAVNDQPGTATIQYVEYSDGCTSSCPQGVVKLTKFPNGWGEVQFWADSTNLPPPANPVLHWDGPVGATYTIQYYTPQSGVVNVPGPGDPPLGNTGRYPAQNDPGLGLTQSTIFTLSVAETIDNTQYHAQMQLTIVVPTPAPEIVSFVCDPATVDPTQSTPAVYLQWKTSHVSKLQIQNVGTFTDDEAASGSAKVAPTATANYYATGYGETGYTGAPATATATVTFEGTASSGPVNCWSEGSGTMWTLKLDQGRTVGELYRKVSDASQGGLNFDVNLKPASGVLFADLGTQRSNATYTEVQTGSYGTTIPRAEVWDGWDAEISDDIFAGGSDNLGATWGVKFSDGSLVLLWYDNCSPGNQWQQEVSTTFTFKWINFGPLSGPEQATY